jgi:hypothetical protein
MAMTTRTKRVGLVAGLLAAAVMAFGATALADGDGKKCGEKAQARFQKADKNSDGFLTKVEVGDKKWERISLADANKDAKVSLAEMKQAKADGKLGKKGRKGKKEKKGSEA